MTSAGDTSTGQTSAGRDEGGPAGATGGTGGAGAEPPGEVVHDEVVAARAPWS